MLKIMGVTKDFNQYSAQKAVKKNELHRIHPGIFCEPADLTDLPAFMNENALRILNFLFKDSLLIEASAFLRGPVLSDDPKNSKGDGASYNLYVASNRARTIELPHLKIIFRNVDPNDTLHQYCRLYTDGREDALGALSLRVAANEVIFLHNFSIRRFNLERFLSPEELAEVRITLEETHKERLPDVLKNVATTIGDLDIELSKAIQYLKTPLPGPKNSVRNQFEFSVGWYRREIAKIAFDGVSWKFNYATGWMLPLSAEQTRPGEFPTFITNMAPEGCLLQAINDLTANSPHKAKILSASERYLANVTIVDDPARVKTVPLDYLHGKLEDFSNDDGSFSGTITGIPKVNQEFNSTIHSLMSRKTMPRMSGYQAKIPMHLDLDGNLSPAESTSFTHILKLPGVEKDPLNIRGAIEWVSMTLARNSGVKTCEFSLLPLNDGSVAYVTERFDIPKDAEDPHLFYAEDFCSVIGYAPAAKMLGSSEEVCDALRGSTNFSADAVELYKLMCATVLLENGDLHLKNLALIKVAAPTLDHFRSIRLSPAYDIVNTRFFTGDIGKSSPYESLVLPIDDKCDDITVDDLVVFGGNLDIDEATARHIALDVAANVASAAKNLINNLPEIIKTHEQAFEYSKITCERAVARAHVMFPEIDPQISMNSAQKNKLRTKMTIPA